MDRCKRFWRTIWDWEESNLDWYQKHSIFSTKSVVLIFVKQIWLSGCNETHHNWRWNLDLRVRLRANYAIGTISKDFKSNNKIHPSIYHSGIQLVRKYISYMLTYMLHIYFCMWESKTKIKRNHKSIINEHAKWNLLHCFLIIFYILQSYLYKEVYTSMKFNFLIVGALLTIKNNEASMYKVHFACLCKCTALSVKKNWKSNPVEKLSIECWMVTNGNQW